MATATEENVSAAEAKALIDGKEVLVIDVREPSEFASGRIPEAKPAPLGSLEKAAAEWNRQDALLVYCQSGKRSERAVEQLRALGFRDVASLKGGLSAWTAAGFVTEKTKGAPWSLERQVRFTVGVFVSTFMALGIWVHPGFFALDFFVAAGLIFSAVTNTCGMALVLTKMPWNRV